MNIFRPILAQANQTPRKDPDPGGTNDVEGAIDVDPGTVIERVDNMVDGALKLIPNLLIAVVIFFLIVIIGKIVRSLVLKAFSGRDHENIGLVLGRLIKWGAIIFGLLIATTIVIPGVGAGDLLASLGIGGVAIGFAFKDILQNLLAGILILIRQPFKIGDSIQFGDYEGIVEHIETRSTIIKTYDGRRIIIPNGEVYTNPVVVNTAYETRRSEYVVGIGYGDDIAAATNAILETVKSIEGVESSPEPEVLVAGLGDSTVDLKARWWTDSNNGKVVRIKARVLSELKKRLDLEGVDMPYPTQVLLFHDQTEESDGDRSRQREGWPKGDNPPKPRYKVLEEKK